MKPFFASMLNVLAKVKKNIGKWEILVLRVDDVHEQMFTTIIDIDGSWDNNNNFFMMGSKKKLNN